MSNDTQTLSIKEPILLKDLAKVVNSRPNNLKRSLERLAAKDPSIPVDDWAVITRGSNGLPQDTYRIPVEWANKLVLMLKPDLEGTVNLEPEIVHSENHTIEGLLAAMKILTDKIADHEAESQRWACTKACWIGHITIIEKQSFVDTHLREWLEKVHPKILKQGYDYIDRNIIQSYVPDYTEELLVSIAKELIVDHLEVSIEESKQTLKRIYSVVDPKAALALANKEEEAITLKLEAHKNILALEAPVPPEPDPIPPEAPETHYIDSAVKPKSKFRFKSWDEEQAIIDAKVKDFDPNKDKWGNPINVED